MDIQSLLPHFLGNNNKDMEKILSMVSGNKNKESLLKDLMDKSDPKTSTILSLLKNNGNQKQYYGLSPIKDIANDEIFGRLTKHYLSLHQK
ncbi:MAG: hypothetical protein J6C23_04395 [Clostridia bacterium]|nr:hypothetical protein [Clostridia bacterium]